MTMTAIPDVSVIIPAKNASPWIKDCLNSVLSQEFNGLIEVSCFDDGSTDDTWDLILKCQPVFMENCFNFVCSGSIDSGGVGFAKNRAVEQSNGSYVCFLDADDSMDSDRVQKQWDAAVALPKTTLLGARFRRVPAESTSRYTRWVNGLSPKQLYSQAFTANGPSLVAPTWFFTRELYYSLDGFSEKPKTGFPEDLDFFYRHLRSGGTLFRVDEELVSYRYHPQCASFSVSEQTIWEMRLTEFQRRVLDHWSDFMIWNAGKQGKKFYNSLSTENKRKVSAFIDVDSRKLKIGFYEPWEADARAPTARIPIESPLAARPPTVVCVKQDMTGGDLEKYIRELCWEEGTDFYFLS